MNLCWNGASELPRLLSLLQSKKEAEGQKAELGPPRMRYIHAKSTCWMVLFIFKLKSEFLPEDLALKMGATENHQCFKHKLPLFQVTQEKSQELPSTHPLPRLMEKGTQQGCPHTRWTWTLVLPYISCENLGKIFNFSDPWFPHL